jgi:hypothetical protein
VWLLPCRFARPPKGFPACGDGIRGYAVHRPWSDLREIHEVTTSSVEGVSPSVEPRSSSPSVAVRRLCLSNGRDVMRVNTGVIRGCTCARHGGYSIGMALTRTYGLIVSFVYRLRQCVAWNHLQGRGGGVVVRGKVVIDVASSPCSVPCDTKQFDVVGM